MKDNFHQSAITPCYTDLKEELTRDFEAAIILHFIIVFLLTVSTWKYFSSKTKIWDTAFLYRNFKTMQINQMNNPLERIMFMWDLSSSYWHIQEKYPDSWVPETVM